MKVVSYTKARNSLRALIDEVVETSEETIITSKDDGKEVVVMSLADYNGWLTTNHLLSSPVNADRLRESIAEARRGKAVERDLIDE